MLSKLFLKIKNFTYTAKEKAFVAFWVSGLGSYLAQNGLTWHDLLTWSTLIAAIIAVVTHQVVYWTQNSHA